MVIDNIDLNPLETKPISKKSLVVFFVIDTSESMKGKKIKQLNDIMSSIMPDLVGVGGSNTDLKYAVLTFSSGCEWKTSEPLFMDDCNMWRNLEADGITDLGMAFEELSKMMSRKKFLKSPTLSYAPVMLLITDGYPTDNYKKGLNILKSNKWYKYGIKIALGIGEYLNESVLAEFTEDKDLVFRAYNPKQLRNYIKEIVVHSSQIGSQSMPIANNDSIELSVEDVEGSKQKEISDKLKHIKEDDFDDGIEYEDGWD